MLALVVLYILSPGLHQAPTSHPPSSVQYPVPQSFLGAWMCVSGCSQINVLSCAFQETAVYGEHIWFETNVSGDFCYVGEQNCMAKLLVSGHAPPWQGPQMRVVLLPGRDAMKASAGGHVGGSKVRSVSLLPWCAGGL